MRAPFLVVPVLLLAGCMGALGPGRGDCPVPEMAALFPPGPDDGPAPRAPGEAAPMLAWASYPMGVNGTLALGAWTTDDPAAYRPTAEEASAARREVAPGDLVFAAFSVPADGAARSASVRASFTTAEADCGTMQREDHVPLAPPVDAPRAAAGKGVLVHTAGFWTNGTSFYANHAGVHARADVPKSYLGEYGGAEPLKVYVYDADPSEMPRRYAEAGYATTIRGFNEALKGIPTVGARVAQLAPEEAYTAPGRESHPLYGDALVFWIEAAEVVDLPCPLPQPACDLPRTPGVPPPPPGGAPFG